MYSIPRGQQEPEVLYSGHVWYKNSLLDIKNPGWDIPALQLAMALEQGQRDSTPVLSVTARTPRGAQGARADPPLPLAVIWRAPQLERVVNYPAQPGDVHYPSPGRMIRISSCAPSMAAAQGQPQSQ